MGRFDSRGRDSGRGGRGRGRDFGGRSGGRRDSGRSYGGRGGSRRDSGRSELEMTKVICASCNQECEIPFKPKTDKPVYCSDCYSKTGDGRSKGGRSSGGRSSNGPSTKDFDQINEKLNKIMKALNVE